jgi:hypothetical protein
MSGKIAQLQTEVSSMKSSRNPYKPKSITNLGDA